MTKHFAPSTLAGKELSVRKILRAEGLYWSSRRVRAHCRAVEQRGAPIDKLLVFVSVCVSLGATWVAMSAIENLSHPHVAMTVGLWIVFSTMNFFIIDRTPLGGLPRWRKCSLEEDLTFRINQVYRELPPVIKEKHQRVASLFPGAKFRVRAFGSDPLLEVSIPGDPDWIIVAGWDYDSNGEVIIL